ncbi:phospholipase A [Chromatiaceae bacterium AAb-1]|nr:phospholipase A [Chromatiaceae bacterium AAb-1]
MLLRIAVTGVFSLSFLPLKAYAQEHCRDIADNSKRLECYDKANRRADVNSVAEQQVEVRLPPVPAQPELTEDDKPQVSGVVQTLWELDQPGKRGTFHLRTHQPSFILPYHYTSNINRQPYSPSRGDADYQENYKQQDTKFQVSVRSKLLENIGLPGADLWFAYTQTSLWQLWNSEDSAPFRSTDYQPELIYVVPTDDYFTDLVFGWNLSMLQFGLAHQSNGQSEPLSRSWNRIYAGLVFSRDNWGMTIKANRRISEDDDDNDNPDLTRMIGSTEITLARLSSQRSNMVLTRRMNWHDFSKGSWQLDFTYPLNRNRLDGIQLHLQLFSGYGETLLDYNHRQNSVGVGLLLFNF